MPHTPRAGVHLAQQYFSRQPLANMGLLGESDGDSAALEGRYRENCVGACLRPTYKCVMVAQAKDI